MLTREEYIKFENTLKNKGYNRCDCKLHNEDYYFYKGFGKSEYEENRSNYQIIVKIYDMSPYMWRDRIFEKTPYTYEIICMVSRCVEERIDLHLPDKNIEDIEDKCSKFFEWVKENYKL